MGAPKKSQVGWDGIKLRIWRQKNNIDMDVLSCRTGIPQQTLYRYENGRVPPIERAHKLVSATKGGVRYRDFYQGFMPEFS